MVLNYKYRIYPENTNIIDKLIFEYNQAYNISISLIQTEGRKMYDKGISSKDIFNELYRQVRFELNKREIYDKSALTQDALRSAYNTLFTNIKQKKPFNLHFKDSSSLEGSFTFRTDSLVNKIFRSINFKTNIHRDIPDNYRILGSKIKREGDKYYIIYTITDETVHIKEQTTDILGIDSNQGNYTFSNGYRIDFVKSIYPELEAKRVKAQKTLSSKKKKSKNRKKKQKLLFNISRKIKHRRKDDIQKRVTKILNETTAKAYAIEKLNIKKMTKNTTKEPKTNKGLTKNMLHIAHAEFFACLDYKSVLKDRFVVKVNPAYTSQTCSRCGAIKQKTLSEREHVCSCGLKIDRDLNAAINIYRLGLSLCS